MPNKSRQISVRLSQNELDKIDKKRRQKKFKTRNSYIRFKLLSTEKELLPTQLLDLFEHINRLSSLGNLLKLNIETIQRVENHPNSSEIVEAIKENRGLTADIFLIKEKIRTLFFWKKRY